MIDAIYKDSLNDKTNSTKDFYLHLNDDQTVLDIVNYNFPKFWKGEKVHVQGTSISKAIESLRIEVEKLSRGISNSLLSVLNDPPVLQSLKTIYNIMITAERTFGTNNNLSDFPYMELSYIISNFDDINTKIYAIECLKMAIIIDPNSIESKITEDVIVSLEQLMFINNENLCQSVFSIIGYLNQLNPELCERFCSNGLVSALIPYLQNSCIIQTIKLTILRCPIEFSLKFLFLLFISILKPQNDDILINFFDSISIFAGRFEFDSIPEQLSDNEILPEQIFECRKIIFELLENYMINSKNYRLILSIVEFCAFIPSYYPLNIHQSLLKYLTDETLINKFPILIEKISTTIIRFYNQWKEFIQIDSLKILYDFVTKDKIDFQTSFAYVKLIIVYYQIQSDDSDISMVELCMRYIGCSDTDPKIKSSGSFLSLCIGLISEIIENFSNSGQIVKVIQCTQVLNEARDDLLSKMEDPNLKFEEKEILEIILNTLDTLINQSFFIFKDEDNESGFP